MANVRWSILVVACVSALGAAAVHGTNNGFPNKPLRIIVPFPPGGSNDLLARYFADKLMERMGQQVIIDNRGGANGIIGTDVAAQATPDGYNMLIISTSFTMNAAVRKLPYDVHKSFDPIAFIGSSPNSMVIFPGWQVNGLKEVVAMAKANPGALMYAHTGVGGFNHFGGELFKRAAGIDMGAVPYKGGGPAMIDVMAGQMKIMFSSLTQCLPHVRSGKLKLVAVGADKRSPTVPDVPTFIESGFPGYEVYVWWGVAAPAGVPQTTRDHLTRAFGDILRDPGTRKRLATEAAEVRDMDPPAIRKLIADEVAKWNEVAKSAGIRVN
ncbi:MAG: tripartite tricarboxylate transporter substrate binding protein [Burkholderiales bacterium]|nr:tripartite tricarboxylate transporter substrate binding protein [Burkholderiales bacterium]